MDMLRRNTDYAILAVAHLAKNYDKPPVSAAKIASDQEISYQLTCKLLQKLAKAKLVMSTMGPKGGFSLSRDPAEINLLDVISAIQGPISLNRCLLGMDKCPRQLNCPVSKKLENLQGMINGYLTSVTLDDLLHTTKDAKSRKSKKRRRAK